MNYMYVHRKKTEIEKENIWELHISQGVENQM